MFTPLERLERVLEVFKDAFDDHPTMYKNQETPGVWEGHLTGPPQRDITITLDDVVTRITVRLGDDIQADVVPMTFEDLEAWAFAFSRKHGLQDWISPRHFGHLVNLVFALDPPLPRMSPWPHTQDVDLPHGHRLTFEWDEDDLRLVAVLRKGIVSIDRFGVRHADDALGWLTHTKAQIQRGAP